MFLQMTQAMTEHDKGYRAGWENAAKEALFHCGAAIDRLEPGKDKKLRDVLQRLESSMKNNLLNRLGVSKQ